MTIYARAGERVYGTRTRIKTVWSHGTTTQVERIEDYHHCTVRHDLLLGELPDFPECLGDWQQAGPPRTKQSVTQVSGTGTAVTTSTTWIELDQHGGGKAPTFGVPWSGESWWRPYAQTEAKDRLSVAYDLRFRGADGTCTWGMDRMKQEAAADLVSVDTQEFIVTDEEAAAVGLDIDGSINEWRPIIAPILAAKGVPVKDLAIGSPTVYAARREGNATVFVFDPSRSLKAATLQENI